MIITRTPFRVSFAGGGSDLKKFYSSNGYGAVVSTAIQQFMYIVIHPYFHDKIRIKYSRTEDVNNIEEVKHPIVRECLRKAHLGTGIEVASFADIPSGTGLGSSSAFTVGLLHALYAYKGILVSKERLAREACEIEIDILGEPIGKQDQYAAAYGGLNHIRFNDDESVEVTPIPLDRESVIKAQNSLRLYYLGGSRSAGAILSAQKNNMDHKNKFRHVQHLVELADELRDELTQRRLHRIGEFLDEGWQSKKQLADSISNQEIDALYSRLLEHGASGGKLLGAGGAGFILVQADDHSILEKNIGLKSIEMLMDKRGSTIIHYG